jgi:hypothetical protein
VCVLLQVRSLRLQRAGQPREQQVVRDQVIERVPVPPRPSPG